MEFKNIDEIQETWQFVSALHDGQKYGGEGLNQDVEYINHIGGVFFEIVNVASFSFNFDVDLAAKCALLHDSLEDTRVTYAELFLRYGEQTAEGVLALTKNVLLTDRTAQMRDSLKRIKKQPKEIWAVKLADRICNLFAPPYYWDNQRKKEYLEEAYLIYGELKEGNSYLAGRLMNKIENYRHFINY